MALSDKTGDGANSSDDGVSKRKECGKKGLVDFKEEKSPSVVPSHNGLPGSELWAEAAFFINAGEKSHTAIFALFLLN